MERVELEHGSQRLDEHADEQNADATLLRPAVDPTVPPAARRLLLTADDGATPLGPLPLEPERRLATASGAASGLTAGMAVAVTGAAPWAIGVLIFQGAVAWQSATGRWALMGMELIAALAMVVLASQVARLGQSRTRQAAAAARSKYRGRYLTEADLDAPARVLLRRAQAAIDTVEQAEVTQAGLLDERPALAAQEWHIAVSLREQSRLRARRAEITEAAEAVTGPATAEVLRQQLDLAQAAGQSVAERVAALERYAGEVRTTDTFYRDHHTRTRLAELTGPHLDMLARTAADSHGIAELAEMTERVRAIRSAYSGRADYDSARIDSTDHDSADHDGANTDGADSDGPPDSDA